MSKQRVSVRILNNSDSFIGEPLYLAGTFNNWSVEHLRIGYIPSKGEYVSVVLPEVAGGELELKLSRGSWDTLASSESGKLVAPQTIEIDSDVEINLTIDGWRDLFPPSTATEQVHILDEYFYFPNLQVYRRVWIYLPKGYSDTHERYPVIYMHDGQHLFDEATSVGRAGPVEWMVDETIDDSAFPSIVVAVDHAKNYAVRQREFLMHPVCGTDDPQGWLYLEDIIQTLKPFVDKNYRTRGAASDTALVGSSLGGLVSIYAGLEFPEVFGTLGIFSPSIWMDQENLYRHSERTITHDKQERKKQAFYFYVGGKERRYGKMDAVNNMTLDLDRYVSWLTTNYPGILKLDINPQGKHGATYWQLAFQKFYTYWQTRINSH